MSVSCDIGFSRAVRLAGTGIRPKSGIDVTVEAAQLAMILRGDQALDPQGLKLLALAVTGKLRKIKQPSGETVFGHAVRRASAAWRSGKKNSPADVGALLAEMLLSGQPALGAGERQELSELFSPQPPNAHNARHGRPSKGAGHADVAAVVEMLRNEIAKGFVHKYGVSVTAERFKISHRTVEEYEAMTKEREAVIETALGATER